MRTTLILNDELAIAAKRLAADRRVSFSQVVNDALRREVTEPTPLGFARSISIPIFGAAGASATDSTPAELDALMHDDFADAR